MPLPPDDGGGGTHGRRGPMIRLVLRGPRDVELVERAEPRPPRGANVLVRAELSLISAGTERRLYLDQPVPATVKAGFELGLRRDAQPRRNVARYAVTAANAAVRPAYPTSLGYNTVGVVESVGQAVTMLQPGDRVLTTAPHAEWLTLPEWQAVSVPAAVPSDQAIFGYMATLGFSALRRIGFQPGENVAVLGLGIVGATASLIAAANGARVVALETDPFRRGLGERAGTLRRVLDPADDGWGRELADAFAPEPVHHVVETVGSTRALEDALRIVPWRGRIAVLALHPDAAGPSALGDLFHEKECSLVSCANDPLDDPRASTERFTIPGNMRAVLDQLAAGRVSFAGLLTHTYPVRRATEAYAHAITGVGEPYLAVGLDWTELRSSA